jgi:hypothetical protein
LLAIQYGEYERSPSGAEIRGLFWLFLEELAFFGAVGPRGIGIHGRIAVAYKK